MTRAKLVGFRPPRIAIGCVVIAIATHALLPLRLHAGLPVTGAVVAVLGCALTLRAWWLFKIADTAICPTRASTHLVTHDIFSVTRNPMYLGMVLMLMGLAVAVGSAAFYIAAISFGAVMQLVFCPYEESKACAEFGADYLRYAESVRRWL